MLTQFGIPATLLKRRGGLDHRVADVGRLIPQPFADLRGEFLVGIEERVQHEGRVEHADVLPVNDPSGLVLVEKEILELDVGVANRARLEGGRERRERRILERAHRRGRGH